MFNEIRHVAIEQYHECKKLKKIKLEKKEQVDKEDEEKEKNRTGEEEKINFDEY